MKLRSINSKNVFVNQFFIRLGENQMSEVVLQCIKNRNRPTAGVHQLKERRDTTDASSADSAIDL